jgi:hypothetical protein
MTKFKDSDCGWFNTQINTHEYTWVTQNAICKIQPYTLLTCLVMSVHFPLTLYAKGQQSNEVTYKNIHVIANNLFQPKGYETNCHKI